MNIKARDLGVLLELIIDPCSIMVKEMVPGTVVVALPVDRLYSSL